MRRSWSIRSQVVTLVAAVTLPLAVLGVSAILNEARLSSRLAERSALDVADVTAAGIGQFLSDTEHMLRGMAADPSVTAMDAGLCQPFVDQANSVLLQYTNFLVLLPDGSIVCSALPASGPALSEGDVPGAPNGVHSERLTVGRPQLGGPSDGWGVLMAVPVEADGRLRGYFAASVDLGRFHVLLTSADLPAEGVVTLAQMDGTVVARSADPETWMGKQRAGVFGREEHALLGRGVERGPGIDGVDRVYAFRRVADSDWMVYAGVPSDWVYGRVRNTAVAKALPGIGVLVLLTLLATSMYRRITGSLAALVEGTRLAADGGEARTPTEGPAEVIAVAEHFNRALAERDTAVEALELSRQRYRSILDNAVIGIYVSTRDGRIIEANPALARMLGYDSPDELLNIPMTRFYPDPLARDRVIDESTKGRREGETEVEWIGRDGTPLTARLHWNLIEDPEGEVLFEVLAEDLTERKALEEQFRQAQKLEAVGRLAGGVAHDFNNRLTVIQGHAQLLLVDLEPESPLRQNVDAILESTERASGLTRQLLAFGRKQLTRPRVLDLNEVVDRLGKILHRVLGEDVRLHTELADGSAPIRADPGEIEQILLNLCTNARDAMPDGGRLTLRTERRTIRGSEDGPLGMDPGDYVLLTVADTGHGMDEATQRRLFEPFFTTKPAGKGTGLGLSTVYGLVVQSGGRVQVRTAPGRGTSFEIWYPMVEGAPGIDARPFEGSEERHHSGETILVAEDEDAVRDIVVRTLDRAGYRVLAASHGDEALTVEAGHDEPIHLLLTDLVMPGMQGQELAEQITKRRPETRVLFMSGYTDDQLDRTNGNAGRELLPKPFTPEQLLRRVRALLEA